MMKWVMVCLALGLVADSVGAPQMVVRGRGVVVPNGDTTPITAEGTDFGTEAVVSGSSISAFLIYNEGDEILTLATPVLSGLGTGDFTVLGQPLGAVSRGSLTSVVITYDPIATGLRSVTISISNNDPDDNPFTFSLLGKATGSGAPEVGVLSSDGVAIADGDASPSVVDETDFGEAKIAAGQLFRTFRIATPGAAT